VILYYMASPLPVAQVRANLMLFLVAVDLAMAAVLGAAGQLSLTFALVSALLLVPVSLANAVGSALFRPERSGSYKALSWSLSAGSALAGLPLWNG
ncbi:MAG: sulfite exporter TauE/SafE family protein, partial [Gemmobacter sp.]